MPPRGVCGCDQGCSITAKHVAALLGNIEERSLGGKDADNPGETSRANYIQELDAITDKNPVHVETFPHGVAIHHGGPSLCLVHAFIMSAASDEPNAGSICMPRPCSPLACFL